LSGLRLRCQMTDPPENFSMMACLNVGDFKGK
jgi:hypothetical protein